MAQYLVDTKKIRENILKLKDAFQKNGLDFQLFYSVKSNFSEAVLDCIKQGRAEYEIVSDFEWSMVKKFMPEQLVLNGPGKSVGLVRDILESIKTLYFNVDNDTDLEILRQLNKKDLAKIKIGLRVYLDKGDIWNRFGHNIFDTGLKDKIKAINSISKLEGIHFHFSTNNFNIENYKLLFSAIKEVLENNKQNINFLDIGGGLPAANEFVFWKDVYEKLPNLIKEFFPNVNIISEAGRNIVSDAVYMKTEIISSKKIDEELYNVAIDINVMHLQCIFEKKFWIEYAPVKQKKNSPTKINIFGNSCMQIDKLAENFLINQVPKVGDTIVIHNIGAYSYSQAANFISLVPEVKIL